MGKALVGSTSKLYQGRLQKVGSIRYQVSQFLSKKRRGGGSVDPVSSAFQNIFFFPFVLVGFFLSHFLAEVVISISTFEFHIRCVTLFFFTRRLEAKSETVHLPLVSNTPN